MATAWVIRAGKYGERAQWSLDNGVSGGGWSELPDLTPYTTKADIASIAQQCFPGASTGKLANYAGQLWALRDRIRPGHLLALPLQNRQIALGVVTSGYTYLGPGQPADQRHVVRVEWKVTEVPRAIVKQDLLFTLGSAMSIFSPSKNDAAARLEHLRDHGRDPGASALPVTLPGAEGAVDDFAVDDPETHADLEQRAMDQITVRLHEEFSGHRLSDLVAAVLEVEGYHCQVSPPGPDGGIDITAGRGPLGLDPPRLVVQVKSGGKVGSPVVNQLQGVMSTHQADQGLLVAWEGLSPQANSSLRNQHLRIRVWEAEDVVNAVLRTYERLSEDVRGVLPLKRVWVVSDVDGS